jgi:hypothetical protein
MHRRIKTHIIRWSLNVVNAYGRLPASSLSAWLWALLEYPIASSCCFMFWSLILSTDKCVSLWLYNPETPARVQWTTYLMAVNSSCRVAQMSWFLQGKQVGAWILQWVPRLQTGARKPRMSTQWMRVSLLYLHHFPCSYNIHPQPGRLFLPSVFWTHMVWLILECSLLLCWSDFFESWGWAPRRV